MASTADLQAAIHEAVTSGDVDALAPALAGGQNPGRRLAIHARHYSASLVTALRDKFPATVWLIGSDTFTHAAREFVRSSPPKQPCIAEYGQRFPDFLDMRAQSAGVPYLGSFARLEWHAGQVSLAVAEPALAWEELARIGPGALPETTLTLQPGLRHMTSSWAVDDLLKLYLTESAPARFNLPSGTFSIEVRGSRGDLYIDRVEPAAALFREGIGEGRTIGESAGRVLERDPGFDTGRALIELVALGLVIAATPPQEHLTQYQHCPGEAEPHRHTRAFEAKPC